MTGLHPRHERVERSYGAMFGSSSFALAISASPPVVSPITCLTVPRTKYALAKSGLICTAWSKSATASL